MTLVLEIEYLSGVSFAAVGPDSVVPDWPPQPDRIFSALVATWGARGRDSGEAEALQWLERLPPPRMIASDADPRTPGTVFVPPNDARSERQKNAKGVLPALRSRQPRHFPASRPHDPVVRLLWVDANPDDDALVALERLAHDTAYIGHSKSLTRCRFMVEHEAARTESRAPGRRVYEGRFLELCEAFAAGRRPLRGAPVPRVRDEVSRTTSGFDTRWLLLEHLRGDIPDIRASALVSKVIRDTLLSGYRRIGLADGIPEAVSGHAPDGSPARAAHIAIVPLAFVGYPHADGHVTGFALVPPRGSTIFDDEDFRRAIRALAPVDEARGRRVLTVTTAAGTPPGRAFSIELTPTFEPGRRSLDPAPYVRDARTFATVTPIVLDRHLKQDRDARTREIDAQLAAACRNIGLPEPEQIVVNKHSAVEGAPSARPSGKAPDWTRWSLPPSLASRHLVHAVFRFSEPVEGPVILGAGRFLGLGLCRPLESGRR